MKQYPEGIKDPGLEAVKALILLLIFAFLAWYTFPPLYVLGTRIDPPCSTEGAAR